MPLAPGRFSTITCCPRCSDIFGAMRRDMMSVVLPGGNGMMMRIGFDGYDCASAVPMPAITANATAKKRMDFTVFSKKRGLSLIFGSLRGDDRQQQVGFLLEVQRHLAAEDRSRPVGRVVMREGAAALHRMLHVRERGRGFVVLVVAPADVERDPVARGDDDAGRPDLDVELDRFSRFQFLKLIMGVIGPVGKRALRVELTMGSAQPALRHGRL